MTQIPPDSALDSPSDAPWLDREEASLALLLGGLPFMMGKKKSHKRCSAVGCDKQDSLLASVTSLGEGSTVCLVAAPGAHQFCLDRKEETTCLDAVLGGSDCLLEDILSIYAIFCGEARSYLPLP